MSIPDVEPAKTHQADLLEAVRGGSREAFSVLVQQHQRAVFFCCLRLSRGDEQLAMDVVQKTFLKAWTHREGFRGDASFKTWLLRIASNLCSNELRRAWRSREVVPPDSPSGLQAELGTDAPRAFDSLATKEARAHLRRAVDSLPDRQREIALLRIYSELSFAEVAAICGVTANNAKVNFHHAVKSIRRFLAAEGVAA